MEIEKNDKDKDEDARHIPDGMRTVVGSGAVDDGCGYAGGPDARVSGDCDRADRESNQLPASQRLDDDRFCRDLIVAKPK
jgi:hypothetical protein